MRFLRGADDDWRWSALATYNGEIQRGIVHTPEYDAHMATEQRLFNDVTYSPLRMLARRLNNK